MTATVRHIHLRHRLQGKTEAQRSVEQRARRYEGSFLLDAEPHRTRPMPADFAIFGSLVFTCACLLTGIAIGFWVTTLIGKAAGL